MMQATPEHEAAAVASHCRDRSTSIPANSDWVPQPPSCPPPVYQLSSTLTFTICRQQGGDSISDSVSPPPYDAYENCSAPSAFTYAQSAGSYLELPSYHSVLSNSTEMTVTARPPVTIVQPTPAVVPPSTYLGWSMINLLFCFWPLGFAAVVYSVKVGRARNYKDAKSYSLTARNLNIAASVIAPILALVVVGAVLGSAGSHSATSSRSYSPNYDQSSYFQSSYYAPTTANSYYDHAYHYSYSYYVYYTYLLYYTVYDYGSYLMYSRRYNAYYDGYIYYSYSTTGYKYMKASRYASGIQLREVIDGLP